MDPITVAFIAGWGRSGSTLVSNVLGELSGVVSLGEARYVFQPGVACGCGQLVADCTFWQAVLERANANSTVDRARFIQQQRNLTPKRVPSILRGNMVADVAGVRTVMERIYRAAAAEANATIVLDSSKHPADAALVSLMPGGRIVHLVRDPRATGYSWSHRRRTDQQSLALKTATGRWIEWNTLTEFVLRSVPNERSIRVTYEEFVAYPQRTTQKIADLIGTTLGPGEKAAQSKVQLGTNHCVNGNPSKFLRGAVDVVDDDAWRTRLPRIDSWFITLAAWPLMTRYGYPLVRGSAARQGEVSMTAHRASS